MADRLPVPGPSYVKDEPIRSRDPNAAAAAPLHAGMTSPSVTDDGWWLAHLWVADDAGVVEATELAPAAGPPPGTPIAALGPRLAGSLSGLIAEEEGRQLIRLRMPAAERRGTAVGAAAAGHAGDSLGSGARLGDDAQPARARADRRLCGGRRGTRTPGVDSQSVVQSRTLAAPGLRTPAHVGLRADLAAAASIVRGDPRLWLVGSIGFALRGGIVLLLLPMLVLPTQVEVRFALGNNLGSTGLTSGFWSLVAAASGVLFVIVLGALYALARLELAAFESVASPGTAGRRATIRKLFLVQAGSLLLALIAALPLALALGDATLNEIVRPSSADSIYLRVLGLVAGPLIVWAAALVVIEAFSAIATRTILARAADVRPLGRGSGGMLRWLAIALIGWLLFGIAVLPGAWLVNLAWQAARAAFLSGAPDSIERSAGTFVVAGLLAAVFCVILVVCGIVSALRSMLWSLESVR